MLIGVHFRKYYEKFSGNVLRLGFTTTGITIIFSILFGISLIFISSTSHLIISKNQLIVLTLSQLVESNNTTQIVEILNGVLNSQILSIIGNSFSAVYIAFIGILFLFSRIAQIVNNEKPNVINETFLIAGLFAIILWVGVFLILIGIDPPPSIPKPEILNLPFN